MAGPRAEQRPPIARIALADRTILASDHGPVPMNVAAVVLVEQGDDGTDEVPDTVRRRLARVPRLRQRLLRPPWGCGAPLWVDDEAHVPGGHLSAGALPAGAGLQGVLDEAAALVCTPLDPAAPLWTARWLTGWDDTGRRRGALVVVLHHVVVDGMGGLAVLAALADGGPALEVGPPAPVPSRRALRRDAWRERRWGIRRAPGAVAALVAGLRELGMHEGRPRLVARTSLNRPTGGRRRLTCIDVPLADVLAAARRRGGTVNDLVVVAVVGAMEQVLTTRGERPDVLVVSVPVSARAAEAAAALGNSTGVLPVAVPLGLDREARFAHVAATTARRRTEQRGASAAPLGLTFAALARLGLFRTFVEHQRLVHTFETNLRGPAHPLRLAGREVSAVLPAAVNPGNVALAFDVLSYAGTLTIVLVSDPDVMRTADAAAPALLAELRALTTG